MTILHDNHYKVLAFLFSLVAYGPYAMSIIKNKDTRPTISSWLSWLIMDAAALAGTIAAKETSWQLVAYTFGCFLVIGTCLYKGSISLKWTRIDLICLGIVAMAAVLWPISGNPNVAIVLNVSGIIVGTLPMWKNVWEEPRREPFMPSILSLIGCVFGVLAISQWIIATAFPALTFLFLQTSTVLMICRRFLSRASNKLV